MKKLLIIMISLMLVLTLVSCSGLLTQPKTSNSDGKKGQEFSDDKEPSDSLPAEEDNLDLDEDTKNVTESNFKQVKVYFSDSDAMGLNAEEKEVEDITPEKLIECLIEGPKQEDNSKTIPEGTKLLSIEIKDQVAYVNFNKEFQENHWGGSTGETLTIYSIVNTLALNTDLDITEVQILIDGKTMETLSGHMTLSEPIKPNPEMILK